MMKNEVLIAKMELRELVDTFSNLADIKDAKSQGGLFLPDGVLEFQIGTDGEVQKIEGREALVQAFAATINPCKAVCHYDKLCPLYRCIRESEWKVVYQTQKDNIPYY